LRHMNANYIFFENNCRTFAKNNITFVCISHYFNLYILLYIIAKKLSTKKYEVNNGDYIFCFFYIIYH